MTGPTLLSINVGNTRTQMGRCVDGRLEETVHFPNAGTTADLAVQLAAWWEQIAGTPRAAIVIASVNDDIADGIASIARDQLSVEAYRVPGDLPVPIQESLDRETITGVDRLLNAAAAYEQLRQACVVVDAGTAVTVDFVDGVGTFHGGAIAPGARLQLEALSRHTAELPEIEFRPPDEAPFGRSTSEAMLQGVFHGIRGLVWRMVERYAEHYGAYPAVIATGGDAATLFANDELVDRVVPDLTLRGIVTAARHALADDAAATEERP